MLFLTYAAMYASKQRSKYVFLAHQQEEEELEQDCEFPSDAGPDFVYSMQEVINGGGFLLSTAPIFRMPFIDNRMTKAHILKLAVEDLRIRIDFTTSCDYSPNPCGKCLGCVRRQRAFKKLGVKI
jgi:7-cyano-7-deazaguanine synthase in queuosine biosynthesis